MTARPPGIFVVGTDTGVGKTRAAAAIARTWMQLGHRVGVLKPVSSGAERVDGALHSGDVAELAAAITAAGSPFPPPPPDRVGPIVFEAPLAPPVAAQLAGEPLEPARVLAATGSALAWWAEVAGAELMVVEGVGGLLCPLAEGGWTVADLAQSLDYPLIVVAHGGLGTLNHTLLTVEAARSRGLRVAGMILNATRPDVDRATLDGNAAALGSFLPDPPVPILASWGYDPGGSPVPVGAEANHWLDLAQVPRRSPVAPSPRAAAGPPPPAFAGSDDDLLATPDGAGLFGSSSGSATRTLAPGEAATRRAGTTDAAELDLGFDPAAPRVGPGGPGGEPAGYEDSPRGEAGATSRRGVLLASYASAVTLALGWTLYRQRDRRPSAVAPAVEPKVIADRGDAGLLGERSLRVAPPRPLAADHVLAIGEAKQFDQLRVTPRAVLRQDVEFERVDLVGKSQRRAGVKRALVLALVVENRSADAVFAPLDPAFVRGRSDETSSTFLELPDGRQLYPVDLAADGEWHVRGESFADLRPGESREVIVATGGDAPAGAERGPGTWHVKLRTGLVTVTTIGVRLPGEPLPPP